MYVGAVPLSALKVSRIILNLMRLSMGSQCSADRMGVMCSWWRALCTILAAIFWSLCSFPMSFSVRLARRALHESKRDVTKSMDKCKSGLPVQVLANLAYFPDGSHGRPAEIADMCTHRQVLIHHNPKISNFRLWFNILVSYNDWNGRRRFRHEFGRQIENLCFASVC